MKDYSKLTDEELRVEAARLRGWQITKGSEKGSLWRWVTVDPHGNMLHAEILSHLPDFPHDLNACHEFEKELLFPPTEAPHAEHNAFWSRFDRYVEHLAKMCGSDEIFFATARQRCVALLKTLEK